MRNKLCYILLGVLLSFSFIGSVFATTAVSTVVDTTTVVRDSEVSIKINLKSDVALTACFFRLSSSSDLEFVSKKGGNSWNVTQDGENGFLVENNSIDGDDLTNGMNILELKYKVKNNGKVTIETDNCINGITEEKVDNITTTSVDFTVTEPVDDTTLSSLKVTGGTMAPEFSKNETSYIIDLDSLNFGLSMTTSNPDYQDDIVVKNNDTVISNINNIVFKDASGQAMMPITITVNGKTTYSLLVRYTQKELDDSLKYIKINGSELKLVDGKYDYEYTVSSSTKSFSVEAMLNDSNNFEYVINGGNSNTTGNFNINDVVYVIVEVNLKGTENNSSQYNIKVMKEGTTSKDETDDDKGSTGGTTSGSNSGSNSGNNSSNNVNSNPGTGSVSMFVMAFILVVSLIGSIVLYQKNMESYK